MGAFRLVFGAEMRRRWRSWLALALLIALVGGVVLAAAGAGRRTASAFPRFVAAYGFDAAVYTTQPAPNRAAFPGVASATRVIGLDTGQPTCRTCSHPINPTDFGILNAAPTGRSVFKLVSGHLPDPSAPDQVLASFTLAQDDGVRLGTVIKVPVFSHAQTSAYNNAIGALPKPIGPTVALRVVGFEATEYEFPSGTTPSYDLYTTPAFSRTVLPRTAYGYVYLVRLRHGAADLPRFDQQVSALGAEASNQDGLIASVERSIRPQAIGWWILAALAAMVGVAVIGQALFRQSIAESEDYLTISVLGAERRQLVMLSMARNAVVGLVGAGAAMAVAVACSPIAPLGEARVAEPSGGVSFDPLVLPVGALVIVAVVIALGIWPALRAARVRGSVDRIGVSRPSVVAAWFAAAGARPSAVVGVRNALERRSGGATVPVGSALLGTVLAVTALCATGVFGASLSHLTATPRLYGDTFQLDFTNPTGAGPDPALLRSLEHDRAVTAITEGLAVETSIDRVTVGAVAGTAIRGPILLTSVHGRAPDRDGEIGLGGTTMRQLHAHLGSTVHVTVSSPSGARRTAPFRVVSQISFPVLGGVVSLGTGAAITIAGYEDAICPAGSGQSACRKASHSVPIPGGILASVVPGPRGQAAVSHYLDAYRSITALPITPTSLVNFGEAVNFPLIFGAMLALSGAATLVHLLVVSVARRRREVGLLKALGFVNSQVAWAVIWQATTLALIGVAIGTPLGIVIGQAVWKAFAGNLGVVPVAPPASLALGGPGGGCRGGRQPPGSGAGSRRHTFAIRRASADPVTSMPRGAIPHRPDAFEMVRSGPRGSVRRRLGGGGINVGRTEQRHGPHGGSAPSAHGQRGSSGSDVVGEVSDGVHIGVPKGEVEGLELSAEPLDQLPGGCNPGGASVGFDSPDAVEGVVHFEQEFRHGTSSGP